MKSRRTLFIHADIYTPDQVVADGELAVRDGAVEAVAERGGCGRTDDDDVVDCGGHALVPGFIDVHVHGGGGYDVMHGSPGHLDGMSVYHAARGTTAFLATTVTAEPDPTVRAVAAAAEAMKAGTRGAELVGVHLEGPFLSPDRCGAQDPAAIRPPAAAELQRYLEAAGGAVRLITIAPEMEGALDVIRFAVRHGITVSIGHSDATFEEAVRAIEAGATHVTHLFNGMRGLHHREPGVAGAALMRDELAAELICDGLHVHRELVPFVFRVKPRDKVVLITDCVSAAGCPDGEYRLGSLPVRSEGGEIRLLHADGATGALAGSSLSLDRALRNAAAFTGLPLAALLPALTRNPARQIGVDDRKGALEKGKDADLVILDRELRVLATYVKGKRVYRNLSPGWANLDLPE